MGVREYFSTFKEFVGVLRNRRYLAPRPADTLDSVGLKLEETAAKFGDRTMLLFEGLPSIDATAAIELVAAAH